MPTVLEGNDADRWWDSLPAPERTALRRAAITGYAATEPNRAAELISFIRRDRSRLIARVSFTPITVLLLILLMPLPGWFEASWFAFVVGWAVLAFTMARLRMRRTELRNAEALDRYARGEPLVAPPASWSALGPRPRSYRVRRGQMVAEWLLRLVIVSALLVLASWNTGSARAVALAAGGVAVLLILLEQLQKTRSARVVTISPEWIELSRRRGPRDRWRWDDVRSVRHTWFTATKQLRITPPDGGPFTVMTPSLTDCDEFLALVLSSIPEGRIDRSPPNPIQRILFGIRVPTRERDLEPPPALRGADMVRAWMVTVGIVAAGMIVVTGLAQLVADGLT